MKFTLAMALVLTAGISFAQASERELSAEEVTADVAEMKALNGMDDSINNTRINWVPANSAGKIVIKVHLISASNPKEHLEVFRQETANPDSLTPMNIFDNGASNTALVSSANGAKFRNCGKSKNSPCITPTGNFNIDLMEVMHHSSRFQNAPMPWSMFFLGSVGIAIHGATPSEYKDLGKKASHGCIRIHPDNGHLLYNLIKSEGGTRSGAVVQIH